ncbi:MotA/TolQ/ExbB proton channel family protein [Chamaesiphon minutus]|uniref:Biopolymer transport protein n=1 Tax=Chamaesiphon minutus (strain ATCC 27169 / PCC 6605) TaxID=1173020 RepID=K9UAA0_CHAP6|nr:MotA/TolQ/ExbB proton channel family protein [Chamaesiphon minutus]AFY92042.1 biopolymer transport protein [Chamaesiphon minutus PCC 6605]
MDARELFEKGGPTMWPLFALSILSLATILERLWFWFKTTRREEELVERVLEASANDEWDTAAQIAKQERNRKPIGRFLYAPLKRTNPDPETFKLALEASAEEELATMRKGDKTLESIVALAPLLGLLGTVLGLIRSLSGIRLGDLGTAAGSTVTLGISESLISTATGMVVAIVSLGFFRLFQGLISGQIRIFRSAGNQLELLYREHWLNTQGKPLDRSDTEFIK